jgi:hypothetical protein
MAKIMAQSPRQEGGTATEKTDVRYELGLFKSLKNGSID